MTVQEKIDIAVQYKRTGEYVMALNEYDTILQQITSMSLEEKSIVYKSIGKLYYIINDYEKAIQKYFKSIEVIWSSELQVDSNLFRHLGYTILAYEYHSGNLKEYINGNVDEILDYYRCTIDPFYGGHPGGAIIHLICENSIDPTSDEYIFDYVFKVIDKYFEMANCDIPPHEFRKYHGVIKQQMNMSGNEILEKIQQMSNDDKQAKSKDESKRQKISSNNPKKFDVFISHASEDKEGFVKPLVEECKQNNISVWYDEETIQWGNSLNVVIEDGLSKSRYVILVLSKIYLEKYWTQSELNGAIAKEVNGKRVVLPIWHNIDRDELVAKKPMLADRFAINSDIGITKIVEELKKVLDK